MASRTRTACTSILLPVDDVCTSVARLRARSSYALNEASMPPDSPPSTLARPLTRLPPLSLVAGALRCVCEFAFNFGPPPARPLIDAGADLPPASLPSAGNGGGAPAPPSTEIPAIALLSPAGFGAGAPSENRPLTPLRAPMGRGDGVTNVGRANVSMDALSSVREMTTRRCRDKVQASRLACFALVGPA